MELIPKTHRIWDSDEEYEVINAMSNKKTSNFLKNGKLIELERTDLLLFSANMIIEEFMEMADSLWTLFFVIMMLKY